jgi:glycosyltransferase involved in cell wall biosynthesis
MLAEKGVGEFAGAAGIIKRDGIPCRFVLVGRVDPGNPTSISETQLSAWQQEGLLEWWGWQENIHSAITQAHIVCHPSYREGLPTILLEAAACARPIVTTETAGCRDAVVDGETGILVPVKDAEALARALRSLITDPALRRKMGSAGRKRAEAEFSVGRVITDTLHVYRQAGVKGL